MRWRTRIAHTGDMTTRAWYAALPLVLTLSLAACGGGDDTAAAPVEAPAATELTGPGHWTADQLCDLIATSDLSAFFAGIDIRDQSGIDDPDWSSCACKDKASDPLGPALARVTSMDHEGQTFSDSFEPLAIAGADQSVFVDDLADAFGFPTVVLAAVGDQQIEVGVDAATPEARDFVIAVATAWVDQQQG